MPPAFQLDPPPVYVEGDGSGSVQQVMEDGSVVTSWPDGTSRVDYPDGVATITYPDFAVLNLEVDGSRTLTDAYGNPLDPYTGLPLGDIGAPPKIDAGAILEILSGGEVVGSIDEAKGLVETFADAIRGEVDPSEWVEQILTAVLEVIKALGTEERGCYMRGWCYAVLYGALDLGEPPLPSFSGSLGGPDQDQLNQTYWLDGVRQAGADLGAGAEGVALRNKTLLRIAVDGGDPTTTLRRTWQAACDSTGDDELAAAYSALSWPQPVGA